MLQFLFTRASNMVLTTTKLITREKTRYTSISGRKRLRLTTKRLRRGYYKGKRGTREGRLTSKGNFILDPLARLELVVPDLTAFRLKPYIEAKAHKLPPEQRPTKVAA